MNVLYFDLVGGAAGDMILASLLDLGASIERVREHLGRLGLREIELVLKDAHPAGLRAKQLDVMIGGHLADSDVVEGSPTIVTEDRRALHRPFAPPHLAVRRHQHTHGGGPAHDHDPDFVARPDAPLELRLQPRQHEHHHEHGHEHSHEHAHHRPYKAVRALIQGAELPQRVKTLALETFRRLAEAEGEAHGVPMEEVVFHEVGADDALADIVGVATAIDELGATKIVASPVPLGRGLTRGAHGPIPLPGPATLHLLKGAPLVETPLIGETVTPTGAALLAAMVERYGPLPSMVLQKVGVGAGHKSWPDRPNIVRALWGKASSVATENVEDCVVQANLDDMSPEHLPNLERALFTAGAMDVWTQPIQMKKGRAGVLVSALIRRNLSEAAAQTFLLHSTTLGVRISAVERRFAPRAVESIDTRYGIVRVKISPRPEGPPLCAPEHDDCERLAELHGLPLRVVYEEALRQAWARLLP